MALPVEPVTLSVAQIGELNRKLSGLRHDLNNNLSLIAAATELVRRRPDDSEKFLGMLEEQPKKIVGLLGKFSADLEAALGITRP